MKKLDIEEHRNICQLVSHKCYCQNNLNRTQKNKCTATCKACTMGYGDHSTQKYNLVLRVKTHQTDSKKIELRKTDWHCIKMSVIVRDEQCVHKIIS